MGVERETPGRECKTKSHMEYTLIPRGVILTASKYFTGGPSSCDEISSDYIVAKDEMIGLQEQRRILFDPDMITNVKARAPAFL